MKIAMIGSRGLPETYSGVEVFLKELCPRLVDKGHDVTVFCRPAYFSAHEYCGVKLVRVGSVPTKLFDTMSHSLLSTLHALKDQFDIFHFQALGPSSLSFIPRLFGLPTISTMHSLNWKHSKWNSVEKLLINWLEKFSVRIPARVVAVAKEHQRYLENKHCISISHIPNGVTVKPPLKPKKLFSWGLEPQSYLLYVGRLSSEKGCHYLIEAFKRLNTRNKLVIAGDATNESNYLKYLKEGCNSRILFLGHVSNDILAELYSNALLYILPSDSEGLSISLLEAMSYGCCVLTSSIKENLDVVSGCGETFEAGNVDMLTLKMQQLLENSSLRGALGHRARDLVAESYNWDDICCSYETLYQEILSPGTRQ